MENISSLCILYSYMIIVIYDIIIYYNLLYVCACVLVYVQDNMHMTDERSCRWAPLGWTPNAWLRFPTAPSTSARNGRGDLAPAGSCMRPPRVEVGSLPAAMWLWQGKDNRKEQV